MDLKYPINIDKPHKLDDFALAKLTNNYLAEGETPQQRFAQVACAYADNTDHAQRLFNYMIDQLFVPASPVLSNGGTDKGLPISCFLNEVEDDLSSINDTWSENVWLAAKGGGIGTYWGNLRSIGESCGKVGTTSGIVPFVQVQDSITRAISQGSQRRGASAAYLPISHPEIEEFLDIRKPTGGDPRRKVLDIHHGVVIPDAFMEAVKEDEPWHLRSPKTDQVIKTVNARELWGKLLETRVETGEPYMLFIDNVNEAIPEAHKELGLTVKTSNLCSEITLPTGLDHHGRRRTAVCCLSSLNLAKWGMINMIGVHTVIEDLMRFLDNVLQDFIDRAPESMADARYAAIRERSVGLGTMGFHTWLQENEVPYESAVAESINRKMFKTINDNCKEVSRKLAEEKGACPDAAELNLPYRFSNCTAIAPNASSSILANSVSPSIEPLVANAFVQDTDVGSFIVKNKVLQPILSDLGHDTDSVWSGIAANGGSVQHLDFLDQEQKDVFKTAAELSQFWVVNHAAVRAKFIDQAASNNLFFPANVTKQELHDVHYKAWKDGVKSLYYLRSTSLKRAEIVGSDCLACEG